MTNESTPERQTTLHAIVDPLCGWCHAAEPLLEATAALADHVVVLHGGGLFAGSARRRLGPEWRDRVLPFDARIAELSGQPFSDAYRDQLLKDETVVLDSEPTITALLTVRQLGGDVLQMMTAMQMAYYVRARNISSAEVLHELAAELGLDAPQFATVFKSLEGSITQEHMLASRELLTQVGGRGYPTLVVQRSDESYVTLPHADYYGRPDAWQDFLRSGPAA